ncbi:signal recognition particle-docking protein FtsY [Candidatus Bipolaricaulota bacterium]|nr:signal recognition particle-docking protein FtsY [Candidatus Bipolaricaulota bacterium]
MAWFDRLKQGLKRTRAGLAAPLGQILRGGKLEPETMEELEEALIAADVGARVATELVESLAAAGGAPLDALKQGIKARLAGAERRLALRTDGSPTVIFVAGVNGSGKTTTVAKIAARLRAETPEIPITFAAADTFRAAAIEQLGVWAERIGADIIKHRIGADPAAVVFDAIDHAVKTGGVLLIDTAGRLHTKHNLMEELKKIERTVQKKLGRPSDERLLVLDATTGQNGISQARLFHDAIDLSGIVLTKLDGTAKGGVVLAIWEELKLPILYIGVGEQPEDLHEFSAEQFVEALFSG